MSNNQEIGNLKEIIISHVAKDVLLLTDNVDELKVLVSETKQILDQVNDSSSGYFDNLSSRVIELIKEMEVELRKTGEARVSQISMNVSDNIDKILREKFEAYKNETEKALEDFRKVNKEALSCLDQNFNTAKAAIDNFDAEKNGNSTNKNISGKMIGVVIVFQLITLAAVAANFIF